MRIKVALILDEHSSAAWIVRAVERIRQVEKVEVCAVIHRATAAGRIPGFLDRLRAARGQLVFNLYVWFDRWLNPLARDPLVAVDLDGALAGTLRRAVAAHEPAEVLEQVLRASGPDLIVDFSSAPLPDPVLKLAPLGVCSLYHGDDRAGAVAAGFWRFARRELVIGVSLRARRSAAEDPKLYHSGFSSVEAHSPQVTLSKLYWRSTLFVPRLLRQIQASGRCALPEGAPSIASPPLSRLPTNREALWPLLRLLWYPCAHFLRRPFRRSQWRLFFHRGSRVVTALTQYQELSPPIDRFWADPHILFKDGLHYVFVEEYIFASRRSHIACMTVDANGPSSQVRPVLKRPYDLSYPSLFQWRGELFMLPETCANETIEVYRNVRLPDEWTLHKVLLKGIRAVDPQLFEHGGRWWLFANVIEQPGTSAHDELFLFSADNPLSTEWTPHPMNPIVTDVRRARNGGAIFAREGRLYRPGQSCAPYYGAGLRLQEIVELTPERYGEVEVHFFEPNWTPGLTGVHTLATEGDLTVLDACRWVGRRPDFLGSISGPRALSRRILVAHEAQSFGARLPRQLGGIANSYPQTRGG